MVSRGDVDILASKFFRPEDLSEDLALGKRPANSPIWLTPLLLLAGVLSFLGSPPPGESKGLSHHPPPPTFLTTPLSIEANVGQADASVKFLSRGPDYGVFFTSNDAVLVLQRPLDFSAANSLDIHSSPPPPPLSEARLRLEFVGAERLSAQPIGRHQLAGESHYFLGHDPKGWHTHVPHYGQVLYSDLYPGIDLLYYGRGNQLEYDLVVAPGANPNTIELQVHGAKKITLTEKGALQLETTAGVVLQHPPIIYQEWQGRKQEIPGSYRIHEGNRIRFTIGTYDSTRPLIIDPVVTYATYVESDGVYGLAFDDNANVYLTGAALPFSSSPNDSLQSKGFLDIFVSKFDPTGKTLLYSAYIGGSSDDQGRDIVVDPDGSAYVVGLSSSTDFPTANATQPENAGSYDVVVAKLSPGGNSLEFATYLGGCAEDGLLGGLALAIDPERNTYLTGSTNSPDFPIISPNFPSVNAFQSVYGSGVDAFVAKVSNTGETLVYATFLGGANIDLGGDVEVDEEGHAYVVGTTSSGDFPTTNSLQPQLGGGSDIFVAKFQPDGLDVVYSTFLGGERQEVGRRLALNRFDQVFVTGSSDSNDFPLKGPIQDSLGGRSDIVVSRFSSGGTSLLFSTFIGGDENEAGLGIALQDDTRAWVTGSTLSSNFPVTATAPQGSPGMQALVSNADAFLLLLSTARSSLEFSSYLGGDGNDQGNAIGVRRLEVPSDPPSPGGLSAELASTLVVGLTQSSDFPRTAAEQAVPSGGFVVDLLESDPPQESFPCPPFCFPLNLPSPPFSVTTFPPPQADMDITMNSAPPSPMEGGPASVELGMPLNYTITVTNNGPDSGTGVTVTDILPARFRVTSASASQGTCEGDPLVCTLGGVGVNNQATITINGIPIAGPRTLINGASVFSDLPDPNVSNNSVTLLTEVTVPAEGPQADLSLVVNNDTDPATLGFPFRYTLTVSNAGETTATDIILTYLLPLNAAPGVVSPNQGTCNGYRFVNCKLGSLGPGSESMITVEVIPTLGGDITIEAEVTSSLLDSMPLNNADNEDTAVVVQQPKEAADLMLILTDAEDPDIEDSEEDPVDPDLVSGRGNVTWQMRVINSGPDLALNVIASSRIDVLELPGVPPTTIDNLLPPQELKPMKEDPDSNGDFIECPSCECMYCTGLSCNETLRLQRIISDFPEDELGVLCKIGGLEAGQEFTLDFSAQLTQGVHSNTGNVTTLTFDPDLSNNQSTAVTTVATPAGEPPRGGVGGDEGQGAGCFIATAAFGSPLAQEVRLLRKFRDHYLLSSDAGQFLVQTYYALSPPLAAFISQKPWLAKGVQVALWPVVWWAHLTLVSPHAGMAALLLSLLIIGSILHWMIKAGVHPPPLPLQRITDPKAESHADASPPLRTGGVQREDDRNKQVTTVHET